MKAPNKKTALAVLVLTALMSGTGIAKSFASECTGTAAYRSSLSNRTEFVERNSEYFDAVHLDAYVAIVDYMRDQVTPDDFKTYYLPIKIAAARAKIMMNAHGLISTPVHNALVGLVDAITNSGRTLDTLLSIQAYYQTAVDLLTLQELLKQQLG